MRMIRSDAPPTDLGTNDRPNGGTNGRGGGGGDDETDDLLGTITGHGDGAVETKSPDDHLERRRPTSTDPTAAEDGGAVRIESVPKDAGGDADADADAEDKDQERPARALGEVTAAEEEETVPPLSQVLPRLDRQSRIDRRRMLRGRASVGSVGVTRSSRAGSDSVVSGLVSLAYSASTASGDGEGDGDVGLAGIGDVGLVGMGSSGAGSSGDGGSASSFLEGAAGEGEGGGANDSAAAAVASADADTDADADADADADSDAVVGGGRSSAEEKVMRRRRYQRHNRHDRHSTQLTSVTAGTSITTATSATGTSSQGGIFSIVSDDNASATSTAVAGEAGDGGGATCTSGKEQEEEDHDARILVSPTAARASAGTGEATVESAQEVHVVATATAAAAEEGMPGHRSRADNSSTVATIDDNDYHDMTLLASPGSANNDDNDSNDDGDGAEEGAEEETVGAMRAEGAGDCYNDNDRALEASTDTTTIIKTPKTPTTPVSPDSPYRKKIPSSSQQQQQQQQQQQSLQQSLQQSHHKPQQKSLLSPPPPLPKSPGHPRSPGYLQSPPLGSPEGTSAFGSTSVPPPPGAGGTPPRSPYSSPRHQQQYQKQPLPQQSYQRSASEQSQKLSDQQPWSPYSPGRDREDDGRSDASPGGKGNSTTTRPPDIPAMDHAQPILPLPPPRQSSHLTVQTSSDSIHEVPSSPGSIGYVSSGSAHHRRTESSASDAQYSFRPRFESSDSFVVRSSSGGVGGYDGGGTGSLTSPSGRSYSNSSIEYTASTDAEDVTGGGAVPAKRSPKRSPRMLQPHPFVGAGSGLPPAPHPFVGAGSGLPPAPHPFVGAGSGLPPAPPGLVRNPSGSGGGPPPRPRLGTDDIIPPNAPPAIDFFGSYRDISPTTGDLRTPTSSQLAVKGSYTSDEQSNVSGAGSIVFTPDAQQQQQQQQPYPHRPPSGGNRQRKGSRDRLGSRDGSLVQIPSSQQIHRVPSWGAASAGQSIVRVDSKGSMVRVPSPRVGGGYEPYPSPSYSPSSPSYGSTPIGQLPYHQRRKLMQRKREEEEWAAALVESFQQQQFQQYPSPQQQQQPPSMQSPYPPYRSQQKPPTPTGGADQLSPRVVGGDNRGRTMSNVSSDSFEITPDSTPEKKGGDRRRSSSNRGAPPPRPPPAHERQSSISRKTRSSNQQPQPQQRQRSGGRTGYSPEDQAGHRRGAPSHIRADSTGSISSLGSNGPGSLQADQLRVLTDRLGKDITGFLKGKSTKDDYQQRQENKPGGFLAGVFGNRDRSVSPKALTVEEYHQQNQKFLEKTAPEREMIAARMRDPSPGPPRKGYRDLSPGPPNTRGVHRARLSSIDADDWAENEDSKSGSRESSRSRSSRAGRKKDRSYQDSSSNRLDRNYPDEEEHLRATVRAGNNAGRNQGIGAYGATGFVTSRNSSKSSESDNFAARGRSRNIEPVPIRRYRSRDEDSSYMSSDESDFTDDEESDRSPSSYTSYSSYTDDGSQRINERTSLLPQQQGTAAGISTHEGGSRERSPRQSRRKRDGRSRRSRHDPYRRSRRYDDDGRRGRDSRPRESHHDRRSRGRERRRRHDDRYYDDSDGSSVNSSEHRWSKKKARLLERERARLIQQWRAEARAEAEAVRKEQEANRWDRRLGRWTSHQCSTLSMRTSKFMVTCGAFIANMPLTINAVALAIVTLGVVWFKFAEENLSSCMPVHFHSSQCTFPEFPGCFYCDTSTAMYQVAVYFHYTCSLIAGVLALLFFLKFLIARRVVIDELSSPTTASPAGLICMTLVCVFAGRGVIGQTLVTMAACMHLMLASWFIYMALAYRILPDPSWYPNTVGIGLSAVKAWLYYPMPGHFLMAISLTLNCFFFPISIIRVAMNRKISAPVGWIQMSAPAVALYSLTIMAQPSFEEEHPDVTNYQRVHRMVYLPCMHVLFILSVIGALSSAQSLWARWGDIRKKQFSPAHAAFCFPTLAHANAIQAYRGAIDAFSGITSGSPIKVAIYTYWVCVLLGGTIATFIITAKFFYHLPEWTQIDVSDEIEPPAPKETMMSEIVLAGETLRQKYVSPAVLQANEAGALVRLPDQYGRSRYIRTRKVTALGFEPIMSILELDEEREKLLKWVESNPAKQRHRTLSVPGIDFNYGYGDFRGTGVFDGTVEEGRGDMYFSRGRSATHDAGHDSRRSNTHFF